MNGNADFVVVKRIVADVKRAATDVDTVISIAVESVAAYRLRTGTSRIEFNAIITISVNRTVGVDYVSGNRRCGRVIHVGTTNDHTIKRIGIDSVRADRQVRIIPAGDAESTVIVDGVANDIDYRTRCCFNAIPSLRTVLGTDHESVVGNLVIGDSGLGGIA